ncbi:MAG: shikimate kinase AroL [Desulfovibrio sp.]|nr:shikimate kinase AroL [Desulfovibrio sp.]
MIYLIGPRACGKTSLAAALGATCGYAWYDLDALFCQKQGCTIDTFVKNHGWPRFREQEHQLLAWLSDHYAQESRMVIATGGGIVLDSRNRSLLAKGTVLYLFVPIEELARRLAKDPVESQRPSLTGKDIVSEVAQVVGERDPLYRQCADFVLDGTLPSEKLIAALLACVSGQV